MYFDRNPEIDDANLELKEIQISMSNELIGNES